MNLSGGSHHEKSKGFACSDGPQERIEAILHELNEAKKDGSVSNADDLLNRLADELPGILAQLPEASTIGREGKGDPIPSTKIHIEKPIIPPTTPLREGDASSSSAPRQERGHVGRFGDYELLAKIAHGGMGIVYRARQVKLNRIVALKMILSGQFADEEEVKRFQKEAEAAANLDHPHIVPIYEIGEHDGNHFFSMAYVEGKSLADKLREGPLPPKEAADITIMIAEAIQYAHDNGVIHRDLKPANVLLDLHGQPKVTDFGLAKRMEGDSVQTATGQVLGTPSFMPPEQATGKISKVGPRSDVYALGAILYCSLTGHPPFQAGSVPETLRLVVDEQPVLPRRLNPAINRDLETICLKCLEKEPSRRYSSARVLADDLKRFLAGQPIEARPVGRFEQGWRWCRRNPSLATLAAFVIASLLGGTAVSTFFAIEAGSQAEVATRKATEAEDNAATARFQEDQAKQYAAQAENERQRATKNEGIARQSEAEAKRSLYFADLNLAQQLLEAGDVVQTMDRLKAHVPRDGQRDLRGFEWHYLWRRCHTESFTLNWEHPGGGRAAQHVRALALAPDGKSLVVGGGSSRGQVKSYPLFADRETLSFDLRGPVVTSLAFSPDGAILAGGCGQVRTAGLVKLWDSTSGKQTRSMEADGPVMALAFSADGKTLVTGTAKLTQGRGTPTDRYFHVNRTQRPGAVKLWDIETGELLLSLPGDTGEVFSVAYSPDGSTIAAGDSLGVVHLWDADTHQRLTSFRTHLQYVWSLAFSPDGKTLAAGAGFWDEPGAVTLWDVEKSELRETLYGHRAGVTCVAFSPDGQTLASGCWDNTIKLWDPASGMELNTCYGHKGHVWTLAWTPDSRTLVSGSWPSNVVRGPGEVKYWDIPKHRRFVALNGPLASVSTCLNAEWAGGTAAAIHPDAKTLTIWDGASGKERARVAAYPEGGAIRSVSVSPNGKLVATVGFGGPTHRAKLWDGLTGELVGEFRTGTAPYLTFSPQGRLLAVACDDGAVRLWDVESRAERPALSGHTEVVWWVDFTPDERRLASGSWDHTVKIWDTESGRLLSTLSGHNDVVWKVAFLNGGQTLLSATNSIGLWDSRGELDANGKPNQRPLDTGLEDYEIQRTLRPQWYALLAMAHEERGETAFSEQAYKRVIEILEKRVDRCPHVRRFQLDLLTKIVQMAQFYKWRGRRQEETQLLRIATELKRKQDIKGDMSVKEALAKVDNQIAWMLATHRDAKVRDGQKAVEHARRACELTDWKEFNFIDTLAAAYAEQGDFEKAIHWQTRVLELASDSSDTAIKQEFESRLKLYRDGKPYRQP